jgi:hypothetical protein
MPACAKDGNVVCFFQSAQKFKVEVRVHQVGRDLAGRVLVDEEVRHVYAFRGDLVQRMTIEQQPIWLVAATPSHRASAEP